MRSRTDFCPRIKRYPWRPIDSLSFGTHHVYHVTALHFSISIYHSLKVYADVIVQYVLWQPEPSTSPILPYRVISLAPNLPGHLAWRGVRSGFLRPI